MPDADTAAVHMNAVFIIPVIWLLAREARERNREQTRSSGVPVKVVKEHKKKHTRMMIIAIVAIILQAGGLIGFVYYDVSILIILLTPLWILFAEFYLRKFCYFVKIDRAVTSCFNAETPKICILSNCIMCF